jgi:hypothetical protein
MTPLLMAGFESRRKPNPELIDRYEWSARIHGDEEIKIELATARRTATTLAKARTQFKHLQLADQMALDEAARVMRRLAADLSELVAWAKEYGAYCADQWTKADAAELVEIADKRWGKDAEALAFEVDLLRELNTDLGREAFGDWMHSTGRQLDVKSKDFSTPASSGSFISAASRCEVVAQFVRQEQRTEAHKWESIRGWHYSCSWAEYESYLTHRRTVASSTAAMLRGFTV